MAIATGREERARGFEFRIAKCAAHTIDRVLETLLFNNACSARRSRRSARGTTTIQACTYNIVMKNKKKKSKKPIWKPQAFIGHRARRLWRRPREPSAPPPRPFSLAKQYHATPDAYINVRQVKRSNNNILFAAIIINLEQHDHDGRVNNYHLSETTTCINYYYFSNFYYYYSCTE